MIGAYLAFSGSKGDPGRPSEGEKSTKGGAHFLTLASPSPLFLQVMDKLAKITKLKEEVAGGKQLEKNQLEMIAKEKDLTEELKMLQL